MVAEACQVLEEFKQLAGWRRNSVLDSFQRFSKIWICFCQAASRQSQYQSGSQQFNCSVGLLFGLHHLRCKRIFRFIFFTSSKEAPPPPPVPLHCSLDLPEPENGWPTIHAIDALKGNFFWSIAAMNCVMIKRPKPVNDIVISSRISYKETILQWSFSKCFHSRIDLPYFPFFGEMR